MTSPNVIGQNASKMIGQSQKLANANNWHIEPQNTTCNNMGIHLKNHQPKTL